MSDKMARSAEITITQNGREVTITGSGTLDLTNAQAFREGLANASVSADRVVVDLRRAKFIDTAILEYLARARAVMLGSERRLTVLVSEDSHPLYVLNTVGFTDIMDIVVSPPSNGEKQTKRQTKC